MQLPGTLLTIQFKNSCGIRSDVTLDFVEKDNDANLKINKNILDSIAHNFHNYNDSHIGRNCWREQQYTMLNL